MPAQPLQLEPRANPSPIGRRSGAARAGPSPGRPHRRRRCQRLERSHGTWILRLLSAPGGGSPAVIWSARRKGSGPAGRKPIGKGCADRRVGGWLGAEVPGPVAEGPVLVVALAAPRGRRGAGVLRRPTRRSTPLPEAGGLAQGNPHGCRRRPGPAPRSPRGAASRSAPRRCRPLRAGGGGFCPRRHGRRAGRRTTDPQRNRGRPR